MIEPGKPHRIQSSHDDDQQGEPSQFGSLFDRYAVDQVASREIPPLEQHKIFHTPEGSITGDLDQVMVHWDGQQSYPDTCAIRCQEYILECFTGQEIDERVLVQEALDHGWYAPGSGTPPQNLGDLLELHGVEITRYEHSNIFHLADELAKGHKVMVGLDSNEIWPGNSQLFEQVKDHFGFAEVDHAVIVTGIDTTDPGHPHAIITDPGNGEAFARVPIEQFVEAWRDSDFSAVATVDPAPLTLSEMANFDVFRSMLFQAAGCPFLGYLWDLRNEFEPEVEFPYAAPAIEPDISSLGTGVGDAEYDHHDLGLEFSDPDLFVGHQEAHETSDGDSDDADHSDHSDFD